MPKTQETQDPEEQLFPLNTRLPAELNKDVRKAAIDFGMSLQEFSAKAYRAVLFFKENLDLKSTSDLAKVTEPLYLLYAARKRLVKLKRDVTQLDAYIASLEAEG